MCEANDYPLVYGDTEEFDPSYLVSTFKNIVLFGANHYANKLPNTKGWIVWDKTRGGIHISDQADGEIAWTNCMSQVRVFQHLWKGMLKDSERRDKRVHPTQKPIVLMEWIIDQFTEEDELVYDPYMGAGSTLIAAFNLYRKAIGVEIMEEYCEVAKNRLEKVRLARFGHYEGRKGEIV